MKFHHTLIEGLLLKRYKRFFGDVEFTHPKTGQKQMITVHVPNTGSMKGVLAKPTVPQLCWFSLSDNLSRKLKGTLEAVKTVDGVWVGVNTSHPNKVVQEVAVASTASNTPFFRHWKNYNFYKSEHKISKETRLDGVFFFNENDLDEEASKKHYVEIKNTSLMTEIDGSKHAQFPDSVTERGQKHLTELMKLIDDGHQSELIFTIQRADAEYFSIAQDIDPVYDKLFRQAIKKGLIVTPVIVDFDQHQISLSKKVLKLKLK